MNNLLELLRTTALVNETIYFSIEKVEEFMKLAYITGEIDGKEKVLNMFDSEGKEAK